MRVPKIHSKWDPIFEKIWQFLSNLTYDGALDGFVLDIENRIMRFILSIVDSNKIVMYLMFQGSRKGLALIRNE